MQKLVGLFQSGLYEQVEPKARKLTRQFPQHPFGWSMLGAVLRAGNRNAEALLPMQTAVALLPVDANLHANLGNLFRDLAQPAQAAECYRRALALKPTWPEVLSRLGHIQQDLGLLADSAASFREAIRLAPQNAETHSDLAIVLQAMGFNAEALEHYGHALSISPKNATIHYNRADLLHDLGRLTEAEATCRSSIACDPTLACAHALLGTVLKDLGRLEEAIDCYRAALRLQPEDIQTQSSLLFALNYLPHHDAQTCMKEARRFGEMAAGKATGATISWSGDAAPRRLRVGLISGDLREHPVGHFLEGLLSHIDRDQLELVAFPTQARADALTERIRPHFGRWIELTGKSDDAAAGLVSAESVNILLDLSGHTAHNRLALFSRRLAPVQASWLGYFATTGVPAMDYFIADPWTLPENNELDFVEKIWRLPETRLCFTAPNLDVTVNRLPALDKGAVTFGCFNNLTKLNDDVVALWSRLLLAVPGSRLYLKAKQLADPPVQESLRARFCGHGVDMQRLHLEGPGSRESYLACYGRVDIGLDPFPFPGGTTTVESLWMGVPVLTMAGDRFLSRQGVGLLANAGLNDWIASDPDDYIGRAIRHASDLAALARLRERLRQQVLASPIFDGARFARRFTAALQDMWEQEHRRLQQTDQPDCQRDASS
jgi:protein O-GlcNAc transferase